MAKDYKVTVYCSICNKPRYVNKSYVTKWKRMKKDPLCPSCAQASFQEKKRQELEKVEVKPVGTKAPCGNYLVRKDSGRCNGYEKCQDRDFCLTHVGRLNWGGFSCEKG